MNVCGIDVGDRFSQVHVVDAKGEFVEKRRVPTTRDGIWKYFGGKERMRVALEVGTHSTWVSRQLETMGHEVIVANPSRLEAIWKNWKKTDKEDAECLSRLARLDPQLLKPVRHRSESESRHMALVRSRAALIEARTSLINHVRATFKSMGLRVPVCSSGAFVKRVEGSITKEDREPLAGVLTCIAQTELKVREYDREIERVAKEHYPETENLRTVPGVGPITALTYRLVVQSPDRFPDTRTVASYVGLVPRRAQSGRSDPQLRISKAGDNYLRSLLVQGAHFTMGPFGKDSDIRRWGIELAGRGGKTAKKRAAVAVARKLAVVLLAMWKTGQPFKAIRKDASEVEAA
jgi:transposase